MLKIGNHVIENPFILAPMAGVSQMPFRRLALKMGAGLAPTELISAKGLSFLSLRSFSYLIHDKEVERPFCVQLFGGEEESMATAASMAAEKGADIIDINMGCPVKKVTKINAGSALLSDVKRASAIVRAIKKRVGEKIPITAKIRSGWDASSLNYVEVGRALEDAGIGAIALHARTRAQGYSGRSDWLHIAKLKESLSIPVIGNGDIKGIKDALDMQRQTGCDAVMIGRAALGNPWIFQALVKRSSRVISPLERASVVREHLKAHLDLHQRMAQLEKNSDLARYEQSAVRSFRAHLIWYSRGLVAGANFRTTVMTTECKSKVLEIIDEFFTTAKISNLDNGSNNDGIDYRQAFG